MLCRERLGPVWRFALLVVERMGEVGPVAVEAQAIAESGKVSGKAQARSNIAEMVNYATVEMDADAGVFVDVGLGTTFVARVAGRFGSNLGQRVGTCHGAPGSTRERPKRQGSRSDSGVGFCAEKSASRRA